MLFKQRVPILDISGKPCAIGSTLPVCVRQRHVKLFRIFPYHAVARKLSGQLRHAFAHARDPFLRQAILIAPVEAGNYFLLQQAVELLGFLCVPGCNISVLQPIAQCPADFGAAGFCPPAIQLG